MGTEPSSSSSSSVSEFIRNQVPDWDDELIATSRFKALSGQPSDWEPNYHFWRHLILSIAHHFRLIYITPSQFLMYNEGHLMRRSDLVDPTTAGTGISLLLRKARRLFLPSTSTITPQSLFQDDLIVTAVLKDKSEEVVKLLSQDNWTSSCILTMKKFQDVCGNPEEACAILSYLSSARRASHLSVNRGGPIEGVKFSLSSAAVPSSTSLDYDVLQLVWTTEKLQQQLNITDQRYERSRKSALAFLKSGNRQAALRHAKELKLLSESRERCTFLFNRVEEVLTIIANAESTKKVSEAIQNGAQAIKANKMSVEEVQLCLQELDESIDFQKQVDTVLESTLSCTDIEDKDIEEEFKKLEFELESEDPHASIALVETEASRSIESLCGALSNIQLADKPSRAALIKDAGAPVRTSLEKLELESA